MNRKEYNSDPRYAKILEQMDLLGIMDITTTRQDKNGTITWRLPIKNQWNNGSFIEVGSFASGMVRNNNSGYSNYQLNKCKADARYYKDYKWNENFTKQTFTGKYNKYVGKQRVLIPIEIDRLEYLISYCLKNYYIKNANQVPNGNYVPKWKLENSISAYEYKLEKQKEQFCDELSDFRDSQHVNEPKIDIIVNGERYKIK